VRKLVIAFVVAALASAAAIASPGAAAQTQLKVKVIAFTGIYKGQATTQAADTTVTINANGTGKGTYLGAGKIVGAGTADSSKRPCVPFTGTGKMTGSRGTIIFKVNPTSSGCGDDSGQIFSITGKAAVLKGSGKLYKSKGVVLKMTGTYDRSSGAFSVKFTGKLTVV